MPRAPGPTVMATQNYRWYRWYQLEEGSSSEFGNDGNTARLFSPKISSPSFLLLESAQFLVMVALSAAIHPPNQSVMELMRIPGGGGWAVVLCDQRM